ncbi:MAG: recombinase family protein [Fimbriimonadales bacterium]
MKIVGTQTETQRARAYIRVSHVGKARQDSLVSDTMQLEEGKRYAEYLGFAFDEDASRRHADLDVSAFRKPWRERSGLQEHYRAAKRGELDVLIFYKISRLARNVREALDMIRAFEKLGVSFHFVVERIDSTSGHGRFVRNVLLAAAEMQSEDTSDFLKAACERRAREGKLQGGATPAWIKRQEDGSFALIPEQVEAFRRMVALRIAGLGYVRIAQTLNTEGHRTVTGCYWTHGMTHKYLQPSWVETMLGDGFFGRETDEPIKIPAAFPPMLEPNEAAHLLSVQRLYSQDYDRKPVGGLDWMISKRRKQGRYSAGSIHLLSSIAFCPYCGARLVASQRDDIAHRSSPFLYGCPHARTRLDVHQQGLNSVAAPSIEDAVLRVLRGALEMPPEPRPRAPKPQRKEDHEIGMQDKIDRLVSLHLDGKVEECDFRRLYADLVEERERQRQLRKPNLVAADQGRAIELASRDELSREELRQLVLLMVERVESPIVFEGVTIRPGNKSLRRLARVVLKFPRADGHRVFFAPLYQDRFGGVREYWPEN